MEVLNIANVWCSVIWLSKQLHEPFYMGILKVFQSLQDLPPRTTRYLAARLAKLPKEAVKPEFDAAKFEDFMGLFHFII